MSAHVFICSTILILQPKKFGDDEGDFGMNDSFDAIPHGRIGRAKNPVKYNFGDDDDEDDDF